LIRTLVVDGDVVAARLLAGWVAEVAGFEVVGIAGSVAEAADLLVDQRPDLVLLDLYLPDAGGAQVVAHADAWGRRSVDFLVVTASQDVEDLRAAMCFGAVHYLVKPVPRSVLVERLQAYAGLRARVAPGFQLDQAQIDGMFAAARSFVRPEVRHRVSSPPRTINAIEALLAEESSGLTAGEVAERTGLSRATARRNLEQLAERGRVTIELRYASAGRPQHVYRLAHPVPPRYRSGAARRR
jgi:response regulator of citrate/malate metabolism